MTAYRAPTLDEAKYFRLFLLIGIFVLHTSAAEKRTSEFNRFICIFFSAWCRCRVILESCGNKGWLFVFLFDYSFAFSIDSTISNNPIYGTGVKAIFLLFGELHAGWSMRWNWTRKFDAVQLVDKLMDSSSVKLKIPNIRRHIQRERQTKATIFHLIKKEK